MSKFIWIRDFDKNEHYINVDQIIRVTKVPMRGNYGGYAYIVMTDNDSHKGTISLSKDDFDTFEEVITKIQSA